MNRTILHVDLNNFYASVESLYHPELRDKPIAVCGDAEARHGIVLAKNYPAKYAGVKTGDAIWQAKQKCPGIVIITADFKKYLRFSSMARKIYEEYTDQIEPFGIDEAWLDVTCSARLFGDGKKIADTIRQRFKDELGLTASVGVSFNKIFAKLGSDLKKPDATTVISTENMKQLVWQLPVEQLLYVGRSTKKKLESRAIYTIGDLAKRDVNDLRLLLGIWGETLWNFANGLDMAAVRKLGAESVIKSIGNSTTAVRDLMNEQDVKLIIYVLSESIAARLRKHGLKCRTVSIYVRNNELYSFEKQAKLQSPTFISEEIARKAMEIFMINSFWDKPIRSIGVRGTDLVTADRHIQLDLFAGDKTEFENLEWAIDSIRSRFGHNSVCRCTMLLDRKLTGFNPKDEHIIHPVAFSK